MTLRDSFGRQITDLRISVTDRCNFRCVYCRSADPENYRGHDEILSWPELDRLARIFLGLGIRKIRVTGGEPLVRDGVEEFISRLHALGFPDLSMTTNGHLLAERSNRLLAAGLGRINISLDTLDPGRFRALSRRDGLEQVLAGIAAAKKAGFKEFGDFASLDYKYPAVAVATTKSFIQRQRAAALNFVRAEIEGIHAIRTQKNFAVNVLKKYMRISDPEILEEGYRYALRFIQPKPLPTFLRKWRRVR